MGNEKTVRGLQEITVQDLWAEIARRYNVRFGRIEKVFHEGRPGEYTTVELKHREEPSVPNLKSIS